MTEKKFSKNRNTMQRKAADWMMEGFSTEAIAESLGIRFETMVRWQKSKTFTNRIALHWQASHQEVLVNTTRALMNASYYAASHPAEKLGNSTEILAQITKNLRASEIQEKALYET